MHKENKNISILYLIKNLFFIKNCNYPLRYKIKNKIITKTFPFYSKSVDIRFTNMITNLSFSHTKTLARKQIQKHINDKNNKKSKTSKKIQYQN